MNKKLNQIHAINGRVYQKCDECMPLDHKYGTCSTIGCGCGLCNYSDPDPEYDW